MREHDDHRVETQKVEDLGDLLGARKGLDARFAVLDALGHLDPDAGVTIDVSLVQQEAHALAVDDRARAVMGDARRIEGDDVESGSDDLG